MPNPITYAEVKAAAEVSGTQLMSWEAEVLDGLEQRFLRAHLDEMKRNAPPK